MNDNKVCAGALFKHDNIPAIDLEKFRLKSDL